MAGVTDLIFRRICKGMQGMWLVIRGNVTCCFPFYRGTFRKRIGTSC